MKAPKLVLAAALLLATGACHDASKDIEKFADRACACKDAACGEKVLNDFATWAKDNKEARGDQEKANAAAARIGKCTIEAGVPLEKLQSALSGIN
jgi:hypothetical protein